MKSIVRSWALVALGVLASAGSATPSFAELVYAIDGGSNWLMSGTLNGVAFSNATFLVTATADPATVQSGTFSGLPVNSLGVIPTLSLASAGVQFASVTLQNTNGGSWFVESLDLNSSFPGLGNNVFTLSSGNSGWGVSSLASFNRLQSVVSYSGDGSAATTSAVGAPYNTSGGLLTLTGTTSSVSGATFSITAAAVPEIDPATGGSALSLVAGVLAMIEQRRRRGAAAVLAG